MFTEGSVAISTNVGLFLTDCKNRPDKKNKTVKNHNCNHTTFVSLTCPGCNCNIDKIIHFLELFLWEVEKMMSEYPKLMVIPFPGYQKFKSRTVEHNALEIFSLLRVRLLINKIWIQNGVQTKVNLCIVQNVVDFTFISIKFCKILNEKDIKLTINLIQAATTVCSGYLLGSVLYMEKRHWCNIFNKHPKLTTIDVDIKLDQVITSSKEMWDYKKSIKALNIFSA